MKLDAKPQHSQLFQCFKSNPFNANIGFLGDFKCRINWRSWQPPITYTGIPRPRDLVFYLLEALLRPLPFKVIVVYLGREPGLYELSSYNCGTASVLPNMEHRIRVLELPQAYLVAVPGALGGCPTCILARQ